MEYQRKPGQKITNIFTGSSTKRISHSNKVNAIALLLFLVIGGAAFVWSWVLIGCAGLSVWSSHWGIYGGTRLSAFVDCLVGAGVIGGTAFILLRTVFKRLTLNESLI